MCGIFGIIDKNQNVIDGCLKALSVLEYRGYDSCGISYFDNNDIKTVKTVGKIENLKSLTQEIQTQSTTAICHTRWATHGKISLANTHPHTTKNISIVHNGIIENYEQIKSKLKKHYTFYSECDSEVIAKLIDYYSKQEQNNLTAFAKAIKELKGSFAILCLFNDFADEIFCAKKESPLFVFKNSKRISIGSDLALAKKRDFVFEMGESEICHLKENEANFYNFNLEEITKYELYFEQENTECNKRNFKHFMLKEIFDIPTALKNSFNLYTLDEPLKKFTQNYKEVHFIACGTAYHSACVGAIAVQKIAKIPAYSFVASEWLESDIEPDNSKLYVFISQSGETYDTIKAEEKARQANCTTLCITNTPYSTLALHSNFVVPIKAGKEVAVASTKVYNASNLACLYLACLLSGEKLSKTIKIDYKKIASVLESKKETKLSNMVAKKNKIFFIGKGEDYITAKEASLKLKEITYKNCSALPAGELKHGTLALIDNKTLVVIYLTNAKYNDKIANAISEIKARGGKILLVTNQKFSTFKDVDYLIKLPKDTTLNLMLYSIIPMQKLAYYTALKLNKNPDKPRNLAKSVTVA